jgi:hypothetical protein
MILTPHVTRCPACRQPVYALDDLFAAQEWVGLEAVPGFESGLYHHACFRALRDRDAFLELDARMRNRQLDQQDEYFAVLARTPALALALRPAVEKYVLFFLRRGRQFDFAPAAKWREFVALVSAADGTAPAAAGDVRIRREEGRWELAKRRVARIEAAFDPADAARLREDLARRGVDPARTPVDVGAACRRLGIAPTRVSCPPDRLAGTFAWPPAAADAGARVTITVEVEAWYAVELTGEEMDELRVFLRSLGKG